ncbi:MAG TPA: DUF3105 domain-containing protein [Gaiellaceae bacterium]|nr:DUF3105 domain-containing protein [Gaiellaceae bacterium]
MAKKKARTPMPPRTVQVPQRRDTRKPAGNPLAEVPVWVWPASIGLVAGAVIILLVLGSGGGGSAAANVKPAMVAAGCTYRDVPPKPPKHDKTGVRGGYHLDVPTLTTPTKGLWSTSPPSGGAHYPIWAVWGFYTTAVNPRQVVHNEEHGGVIIWWGPKVPQSTITKLQDFYNQQPQAVFGTPYAGLGNKIALTAWTRTGNDAYYVNGNYGMGHIAICGSFNQKAFAAFRSAYRGLGPETAIPISADDPGQGPS